MGMRREKRERRERRVQKAADEGHRAGHISQLSAANCPLLAG